MVIGFPPMVSPVGVVISTEVTVPEPPAPEIHDVPLVVKQVALTDPENVEVAVDVAVRVPAKKPLPTTSRVLDGVVVPIPILPVAVGVET